MLKSASSGSLTDQKSSIRYTSAKFSIPLHSPVILPKHRNGTDLFTFTVCHTISFISIADVITNGSSYNGTPGIRLFRSTPLSSERVRDYGNRADQSDMQCVKL